MGRTGNYSNINTNYLSSGNTINNSNNKRNNRANSNVPATTNNKAEALINIIPDDIAKDLDIKIDIELNSFIVSGPSQSIERFKDFIHYIDKPVPVILIEVMVIEINKKAIIETGIKWVLVMHL